MYCLDRKWRKHQTAGSSREFPGDGGSQWNEENHSQFATGTIRCLELPLLYVGKENSPEDSTSIKQLYDLFDKEFREEILEMFQELEATRNGKPIKHLMMWEHKWENYKQKWQN